MFVIEGEGVVIKAVTKIDFFFFSLLLSFQGYLIYTLGCSLLVSPSSFQNDE